MQSNIIVNLEDYRKLGPKISQDFSGMRLDLYLAQNFPFKSRKLWQSLIESGQILINGKIVSKPSYKLKINDEIFYYYPLENEPEVDKHLEKIYEQDGIMLVVKPSGLPMHEGGRFFKNTFSHLIKAQYGPKWAAVHRLDKETSGLVLCANTSELRKHLAQMFESHKIIKEYIAIAFGIPQNSNWVVDAPIDDAPTTNIYIKKWVSQDLSKGYPSKTYFEVLDTSAKGFCLLRAKPVTGRTNQIRIHAAYSSHNLVGDKLYYPDELVFLDFIQNGFTSFVQSKVIHYRVCLHAHSITFTHPITQKLVCVSYPIPSDMQTLWQSFKEL